MKSSRNLQPAGTPFYVGLMLLALTYFVSGRLGLALSYYDSAVTLVWPPSGIALAVLCLWGFRYWPGVWLGAFFVNLSIGVPLYAAVAIACGNTLGPAVGAHLLRSVVQFRPTFARKRDLFVFVIFGAVVGMAITASFGAFSLWIANISPFEETPRIWLVWWLGDMMGVLIVAPVIMALVAEVQQRGARHVVVETLKLTALLAVVCLVVFSFDAGTGGRALPLAFLPFPVLIWAALRGGALGAASSALALSSIAVAATASGYGPFAHENMQHGLFALWAYLGTASIVALLITAQHAERTEVEAELRQRFSELDSIFRAVPDLFFRLGPGRRIIDYRASQGSDLYLAPEQFLGRSMPEVLPAAVGAILEPAFQEAETSGKVVAVEYMLPMPSGLQDYEMRVVRLPDQQLLAVVRNVTDRKRGLDELTASQTLLESMRQAQTLFLAEAPLAQVCESLLKGLLDATQSDYGFLAEVLYDADGTPILKAHAITNIAWDDASRALYETRQSKGLEFRNLDTLFGQVVLTGQPVIANDAPNDPRARGTPPGHPRLDRFLGLPFFHGGQMVGMIGIANRPGGYDGRMASFLETFLTTCGQLVAAQRAEQRRQAAEQALRESEARYALATRAAELGVWEIDYATNRFVADPNLMEMFGIAPEDATTDPEQWAAIVHPDDREKIYAASRDLGAGVTDEMSVELRMIRSDGSVIWTIVRGRPLRDRDGQIRRLFGVTANVTDRHAAIEQLRRAKEEADQANRAKSEFLTNVSHELRTPLAGIFGSIDLALADSLAPSQRARLEMMKESSRTLLALVNDLLDLAKIEAGKLELRNAPFRLHDELALALKPLAERAAQKKLELALRIAPSVPCQAIGDVDRFRQIVVNLVGNAIKFTDRGGIVVDLDSRAAQDGEVLLCCQVRDTGIGIEADEIPRLFQAFEQLDRSTSRKYGGTGLGLRIVRQLVSLMDGEVQVESTPGQGSCFCFTVRLKRSAVAQFVTPPARLTGVGVLFVSSPESLARPHLIEWLERSQVHVRCAISRSEVLAQLDASRAAPRARIDLALFDAPIAASLAVAADGEPRTNRGPKFSEPPMDVTWLAAAVGLQTPLVVIEKLDPLRDARTPANVVAGNVWSLAAPFTPADLLLALVQSLDGVRPSVRSSATAETKFPPQRPLCVLLADDSDINRVIAEKLMQRFGHQVISVPNGQAAIRAWKQGSFDVVLMDVQMPDIDGLQATAEIRKLEAARRPRTTIVALTAHAMKDDEERCLRAGMDHYLTKPVDARQLYELLGSISAALSEAREHAASAEPAASPMLDAAPVLDASTAIDAPSVSDVLPVRDTSPVRDILPAHDTATPPELADDVRDLVPLLSADAEKQLESIRTALEVRDAEAIAIAAHSFAGALSNFRATRAERLTRAILDFAREGAFEALRSSIPQLEAAVAELLAELTEIANRASEASSIIESDLA